MQDPALEISCIGCRARVPAVDGPTHPYIGASPGCWAIYCRVLGREYGELRNPSWHRLRVDAYAAQHPGVESRRSIRSVAIHLIALQLVIQRGLEPGCVTRRMAGMVEGAADYRWLEPPWFGGAPNVLMVDSALSAQEHESAVRVWAEGVWNAWEPHHAAVRAWAARFD